MYHCEQKEVDHHLKSRKNQKINTHPCDPRNRHIDKMRNTKIVDQDNETRTRIAMTLILMNFIRIFQEILAVKLALSKGMVRTNPDHQTMHDTTDHVIRTVVVNDTVEIDRTGKSPLE